VRTGDSGEDDEHGEGAAGEEDDDVHVLLARQERMGRAIAEQEDNGQKGKETAIEMTMAALASSRRLVLERRFKPGSDANAGFLVSERLRRKG
jgi:hypothetical protein